MNSKKIGVVLMTTALITEVVKKHEENYPHIHFEIEPAMHSSRLGASIYGVPNLQPITKNAFINFLSSAEPVFIINKE